MLSQRVVGRAAPPAPLRSPALASAGPGSRACRAGEGCWLALLHFLLAYRLRQPQKQRVDCALFWARSLARPLPLPGPWAMFMLVGKAPPASLQGLGERGPQLQAWEPRSLAQTELARHPLQWPPYHRGHQPGCLPGALPVHSPTQTLPVARPGLMAASPGACDACHHPSTLLGWKERPLLSVCGRPPGSPEGRWEADTLCLAPHAPTIWARELRLPPSI